MNLCFAHCLAMILQVLISDKGTVQLSVMALVLRLYSGGAHVTRVHVLLDLMQLDDWISNARPL